MLKFNWRSYLTLIFTCGIFLNASGCASFRDHKYALTQHARTHLAWSDYDTGFSPLSRYSSDYKAGWKAGFFSMMTGGDGRLPVLPPKKYWDAPLFLSPDPTARSDWFRGYKCGATTASEYPPQHYVRPFLSDPCCNTCEYRTATFENPVTETIETPPPIIQPPKIRLLGTIVPTYPDSDAVAEPVPWHEHESQPDSPDSAKEITPLPERNQRSGQQL